MKNEHIIGKIQIFRIFKVPTIYARENAPILKVWITTIL